MKIDGPNRIQLAFNDEAPSSVQEHPETTGEERSAFQISLSSNSIQSLKAQLDKLPDVRESKVQALQQAIQSGSYKVDNYQLADAISAELFGSTNIGSRNIGARNAGSS